MTDPINVESFLVTQVWMLSGLRGETTYLMTDVEYKSLLNQKKIPDTCPNLCDYAPTNTFQGEVRDFSDGFIHIPCECGLDGEVINSEYRII